MSFNIRQIRYFVAAAEAGKIVAAASAVGISPSAITEAIQELEEATGTGPRSRAGSPSASPSPWPAISWPPPWRASAAASRMSMS